MRDARKRETYVRSHSFSSELAVKYLHVGRRKIQISPPPGEQDQSNALPRGKQRQSNPHPMPCLPPPPPPPPLARFTLIGAYRCITRGMTERKMVVPKSLELFEAEYLVLTNFFAYLISRIFSSRISRVLIFAILSLFSSYPEQRTLVTNQ